MNRILVTGGSGFIGGKLINLLAKSNHNIRLLSRTPSLEYETICCDFEKEEIPINSCKSIDAIFHLAAFTHNFRDNERLTNLYNSINVDATVQLAKLAVQSGVKRFIYVSSVKAGGISSSGNCMTEIDQTEPEGVYGKTKREAEIKLLEIGRQSEIHISIIRPSLVYGPGVKGNLELMLSGIKKSWFPPLPETGNQRSMIHVDDLVRAILLVAEDKRANGEIFIATDGTPYSSRELYDVMCGLTGKSIPKWSVPKALFDVVSLVSPRIKYKFNKLLGDECYSSAKLEALGFKAKKSIKGMNETDF